MKHNIMYAGGVRVISKDAYASPLRDERRQQHSSMLHSLPPRRTTLSLCVQSHRMRVPIEPLFGHAHAFTTPDPGRLAGMWVLGCWACGGCDGSIWVPGIIN